MVTPFFILGFALVHLQKSQSSMAVATGTTAPRSFSTSQGFLKCLKCMDWGIQCGSTLDSTQMWKSSHENWGEKAMEHT